MKKILLLVLITGILLFTGCTKKEQVKIQEKTTVATSLSKEFNDSVKYNAYISEDVLNKLSNYSLKVNKEIYIEKE